MESDQHEGEEVQRLRDEYEQARKEHRLYVSALRGMVEYEEQGSELWEEYREKMETAGKRSRSLKEELETAEDTEMHTEPLYHLRRAINMSRGVEHELLIKAHNEILEVRGEAVEEIDYDFE